jgi:tetratricopeptide (TPR) repeat protein
MSRFGSSALLRERRYQQQAPCAQLRRYQLRGYVVTLLLIVLSACAAHGGDAVLKPIAQPVQAADPEAARVYREAVKAMQSSKAEDQARALSGFERALELDATLWEAHYNAGVLLRLRGELRKALPHLTAAYAGHASAGEPLLALAEVRHALGEREQAADLLSAYLQQHPGANSVRVALTAVMREQKKYDAALAQAREALVREPANIPALLEVGRIYHAKGDLDVAELVFRKVLALDPKNATAHNDLGLLALARGDTQSAFDAFEKATAADPELIPARMNRASVLLRAGDYAAARGEYEKVLHVAAESVSAQVGLGIALRGLNQPKDAQAAYEKALALAPNHAPALFNLAVLRAEFLNQRAEALPLFERYLELSADDEPERAAATRYVTELKQQAEQSDKSAGAE